MRWVRWTMLGLLATLVLGAAAVSADDESVTMTGEFVWARSDQDISGDLEAVFSPAGDGAWDVVFHFEWEGEMREWKGSATGSLDAGALEGEAVEDRDRERTFVFSGNVAEGVFTGEHGAIRDGEMRSSGTMKLAR